MGQSLGIALTQRTLTAIIERMLWHGFVSFHLLLEVSRQKSFSVVLWDLFYLRWRMAH